MCGGKDGQTELFFERFDSFLVKQGEIPTPGSKVDFRDTTEVDFVNIFAAFWEEFQRFVIAMRNEENVLFWPPITR